MFERLTHCARHAVALANELATKSGHAEVTPEHLLIGVIQAKRDGEQPGRVGLTFLCSEQNVELMEKEVLAALPSAKAGEVLWNQSGKNAVQTAILVAGEKQPVRLGHLILGILMQVGPAATILNKYGVTHSNVMRQMQEALLA